MSSKAIVGLVYGIVTGTLTFAATPACANVVRLGGGQPLEISLARIVAALLFSLIVAAFAILLIRQRGGKLNLSRLFGRWEARRRAIHVVETRRLSPHADICLVRHGDSEYLLLLMAGDARVLSERPEGQAGLSDAQP